MVLNKSYLAALLSLFAVMAGSNVSAVTNHNIDNQGTGLPDNCVSKRVKFQVNSSPNLSAWYIITDQASLVTVETECTSYLKTLVKVGNAFGNLAEQYAFPGIDVQKECVNQGFKWVCSTYLPGCLPGDYPAIQLEFFCGSPNSIPTSVTVQNSNLNVNVANTPLAVDIGNSPVDVNIKNSEAAIDVSVTNTKLDVEVTNTEPLDINMTNGKIHAIVDNVGPLPVAVTNEKLDVDIIAPVEVQATGGLGVVVENTNLDVNIKNMHFT